MVVSTLDQELAAHPHGRTPRALRERQLLSLAAVLFAERGYAGASMDELARRAGVSKPVIYDLIASKETLFQRCCQLAADDLHARVAGAVAAARAGAADDSSLAEAQLRAGAEAFFAFAAEHRRSWAVLFASGTPFAALAGAIRSRQTDLVATMLRAAADELGGAVDDEQLAATAHTLNGAFEALANWGAVHPGVGPGRLAEWFVSLTLPGLQGLAAPADA